MEESLSAIRQEMSATATVNESTLSYDVNELRQQLASHDALMHRLTSQTTELQATQSQIQAMDTDIAGKSIVQTGMLCI